MAEKNTTPRSYTLRLRGTNKNDSLWREHLWRTHAAVNLGAKIFGDFLLTFCGGISHKLVDEPDVIKGKGMGARKDRQIILALSWLSVEDRAGAPDEFIVPEKGGGKDGKYATVDALREILKKRGLSGPEIKEWVEACQNSLEAKIREDAVWVNRAKVFDVLQKKWKLEIDEQDLWDFLGRFLAQKVYMQPRVTEKNDSETNANDAETSSSGASADDAKDMAQAALGWLSNRFGSGEGADYEKLTDGYQRINDWAAKKLKSFARSSEISWEKLFVKMAKEAFDGCDLTLENQNDILAYMKAPGRDSGTVILIKEANPAAIVTKEDIEKLQDKTKIDSEKAAQKIGGKGKRKYSDKILELIERSIGVEYRQNDKDVGREILCVMLDHAARKIISRLSWIKLAEVKRNESESEIETFQEIKNKNPEIVKLLDDYCSGRSTNSNAVDEYRIRRAALGGWKEVVAAWKDCANAEERIEAARKLQDNESIKKFGDINLFTDLADEKYDALWSDPQILENYAAGQQATYDQIRFKVPAYRHPDPLKHPVYCDFGKSRPGVSFSVLERFKNLSKPAPKKKAAKNTEEQVKKPELRNIRLDLIAPNDGSLQQGYELRWQGKRLAKDIGLETLERSGGKTTDDFPRFDRLGQSETVEESRALAIYADKDWNGRLQVSRAELDQLAKLVEKNGGDPFDKTTWNDKARKMLNRLKWFVSFSPKLRYPDTWGRYLNEFQKTDAKLLPAYFRNAGIHFGIGRLSGIPHLRILAMDLGHRFGASCCVWEVVSKKDIEKAAKDHNQEPPGKGDLSFFLKTKDGKTLVFRRIAEDRTKDACWARLERQFTIKLQGEDDAHKPRMAFEEEKETARLFLEKLGRELSKEEEKKLKRIDSQLAFLMNAFRLALRRHADLIRVARDIKADIKIVPGNESEPLTKEEKPKYVLNAIRTWFNLRQTRRWNCPEKISEIWAEFIVPLMNDEAKKQDVEATKKKKLSDDELGEISSQTRKTNQKVWDDAFQPVAVALLGQGQKQLNEIAAKFVQIWKERDSEMRLRMREIRGRIMPRPGQEKPERGKISKEFRKTISRRGGLSMERINLIRELYQAAKAFFQRPGGGNDKIEKGDSSIKNVGQRILKAHEELRRNRVKQLASRIVEAALGLGREKKPVKFNSQKKDGKNTLLRLLDQRRDAKPPKDDSRFKPCHAIVIENLENYRPDQKQTRRENKGLIKWASGKIRDLLKEHCQLYGLFLMEVGANYTSRQDSRTGKPGLRCKDIPAIRFNESKGYMKTLVDRIKKKKEDDRSPREKLIRAIAEKCKTLSEEQLKKHKAFRTPWQGGDLFVAADTDNMGIQADLNAAANIGLRAITDQEAPFAHWKVACDRKSGAPIIRKEEKYDILKNVKNCVLLDKEKLEKAKGDNNVNAWRDVSADPIAKGNWEYTVTYWQNVEACVCRKLLEYNKLEENVLF